MTQNSKFDIELSIVFPAYHEEENLRLLLPRLKSVLRELAVISEVLVIDTEQPLDKTSEVCREFDVRWIPRRGGSEYGWAIRTGIQEAKGKYIPTTL